MLQLCDAAWLVYLSVQFCRLWIFLSIVLYYAFAFYPGPGAYRCYGGATIHFRFALKRPSYMKWIQSSLKVFILFYNAYLRFQGHIYSLMGLTLHDFITPEYMLAATQHLDTAWCISLPFLKLHNCYICICMVLWHLQDKCKILCIHSGHCIIR